MSRLPLLAFALLLACDGGEPEPAGEPPAATLSLDDRIEQLRALQAGRTDAAEERQILSLFQGVSGADLRELKTRFDEIDSDRNLVHLVWSDVDDEAIRADLLAHLATAADGLAERPVRVLSDIDDTIYANWIDSRFPKGTTYPGVITFYEEMARAAGVDPAVRGFATFISARPGDRTGAVEALTLGTLQERGFPKATMLAGTFAGLTSHEAMADAKYDNLDRYRQVFPEYRFVFVGDSGQGDATFGERILKDFPDDVVAVFIHDVVNPEEGKEPVPDAERQVAAERSLYYFDSYPEAAAIAAERGLLPAAAVGRIEAAAEETP